MSDFTIAYLQFCRAANALSVANDYILEMRPVRINLCLNEILLRNLKQSLATRGTLRRGDHPTVPRQAGREGKCRTDRHPGPGSPAAIMHGWVSITKSLILP